MNYKINNIKVNQDSRYVEYNWDKKTYKKKTIPNRFDVPKSWEVGFSTWKGTDVKVVVLTNRVGRFQWITNLTNIDIEKTVRDFIEPLTPKQVKQFFPNRDVKISNVLGVQ